MITPILALVALMLVVTQEHSLGGITKEYATLGFILSIDNLFASILPPAIIQNAKRLNSSGTLKIVKDKNTFSLIFRRVIILYENPDA
jgi:hypothetical protein